MPEYLQLAVTLLSGVYYRSLGPRARAKSSGQAASMNAKAKDTITYILCTFS